MKETMLVYGNCEAATLSRLASHLPCLQDRYEFKTFESFDIKPGEEDARFAPDLLGGITIVWEQIETTPDSADRQALHARLPQSARIIRFPPLTMQVQWPFLGADPRLAQNDNWPYLYPDSLGARVARQTGSDDELFEQYMELSTRLMPDLDRRLEREVEAWRDRDTRSDLALADWVLASFRDNNLFNDMGHPTGFTFRYLLQQLAGMSFAGGHVSPERLHGEIACMMRDHRGHDLSCLPIHPLVAERLRLKFYDPDARYRWFGHEWTFKEYTVNYIRWRQCCR